MKQTLQFCGTAVLIVVLSSFAFADGVLMGDKPPLPPPPPSAESQVVIYPGLVETALNLLTSLLYLP